MMIPLVACGGGKPIEDSVGGSVQGIDHTPPPPPVITTPGAPTFTSYAASRKFTIRGTVAGEVIQLTGPGGVTFNPTPARDWSFDVDLSGTTPTTFTFTAKDFAGNVSTGTSVTITWKPPALYLLGGVFPGASVTNAGLTLESTVFAPASKLTDAVTNFTFEAGFNRAVTSARAL